jgi:hypothetical protein
MSPNNENKSILVSSLFFKKPLKTSFGQLRALYKTHTAWPVPTSGVFVQHRSSEARPCRYFTAFASDRPLSVGGLFYPLSSLRGATFIPYLLF